MMSELIRNVLISSPRLVRRLHPPSTFVEKPSPIAGSSEGTFLSSPEDCQSPQNQAQKRGRLIIYASIEAYEDQFTLSLADQLLGEVGRPIKRQALRPMFRPGRSNSDTSSKEL
jgi:hypothetical protein